VLRYFEIEEGWAGIGTAQNTVRIRSEGVFGAAAEAVLALSSKEFNPVTVRFIRLYLVFSICVGKPYTLLSIPSFFSCFKFHSKCQNDHPPSRVGSSGVVGEGGVDRG